MIMIHIRHDLYSREEITSIESQLKISVTINRAASLLGPNSRQRNLQTKTALDCLDVHFPSRLPDFKTNSLEVETQINRSMDRI